MIISRLRPIRERGGGEEDDDSVGRHEMGHALMRGKAGRRGRRSRSLPYPPVFLIENSIRSREAEKLPQK